MAPIVIRRSRRRRVEAEDDPTPWGRLSPAEQRAWQLLRPHLTLEQAKDLVHRGFILVDVKRRFRTTKYYRIWGRDSDPIEELRSDGTVAKTWCIHVGSSYWSEQYLPDYDRVLAWKLLVESAPRELRRIGNATRWPRDT